MNTVVRSNLNLLKNTSNLSLTVVTLFLLLLLSGNSNSINAFQIPAKAVNPLVVAYDAAIYDSAVYKSENVRKLYPLKFDPVTKKATVVTLNNYDYTDDGKYKIPFQYDMGGYNTWVTAAPEVQNICRGFPQKELELRLSQLLGIKPDSNFTHFVTMEVTSGQIFRPATNSDPTSEYPCTITEFDINTKKPVIPDDCGENFEPDTCDGNCKLNVNKDSSDINYQMWFLNKTLSTYAISSVRDIEGYPWTRLGYTYNWNPNADKYGASEYVIKKNSVVTIKEITSYQDYCSTKVETAE